METALLELVDIQKVYDNGVVANKQIDLAIREGEIHAIVGENGAGKSTLMKIIFGMEQPSSGKMIIRGKEQQISSVNQAIELGIGMVHQHFMLIESFSIADNIMLNMEPTSHGVIDEGQMLQQVQELADTYRFRLNPSDNVKDISVGLKQKVEILKALMRGAKLLILDEPTAVLTPQETVELFEQLKLLKAKGHTILFISHKLKEVKAISDRITVIRKGETMGTFDNASVTIEELSNRIVGRDVSLNYKRQDTTVGSSLLEVEEVQTTDTEGKVALKAINFAVHEGQILGIIGVDGNGQDELVELLTKTNTHFDGSVKILGEDIQKKTIRDLRRMGYGYIPADRMTVGAVMEATIEENMISNRITNEERIWIDHQQAKVLTDNLIRDFGILARDGKQAIESLSGGNIQKVVVARETSVQPKVLIVEQPTRGVDLGAAEIIHKKLLSLKDDRTAILLISADISEAVRVSDQLMIMYEGEIVAYLDHPLSYSEEEIGEYMLGVKRQSVEEIKEAML